MPLVIHPRIRRNARRVALMTALASLSLTGSALAACPTGATTQPFAQFGDTADYALAPGGSFEDGGAGWSLNGNAAVGGNETYFANASGDTQALSVRAGTNVVSAPICVDPTTPYLRFFADHQRNTYGSLYVDVLYTDAYGYTRTAYAGRLYDAGQRYATWAPSPVLRLGSLLSLTQFVDSTTSVRLRLTADYAAGWNVDDVFIDPYRA